MNDEQIEFIQSLREVKVFVSTSAILGIPAGLFLGGLIIGGYMTIFMSFFYGLLFLFAYQATMYFIHKDDPEAFYIWVRAISGVDYWHAGTPSKISNILFIED